MEAGGSWGWEGPKCPGSLPTGIYHQLPYFFLFPVELGFWGALGNSQYGEWG